MLQTPVEQSSGNDTRIELEKMFIAELINSGDKFNEISETIILDDLKVEKHRKIYRAMTDLFLNGEVINYTSLCYRQDIAQDVMAISDVSLHSFNLTSHAKEIHKLGESDRVKALLISGIEDINNGSDVEVITEQLQQKLYVAGRINSFDGTHMSDVPDSMYEPLQGLHLGYSCLDYVKMNLGAMIVVAGRPGMGKTSFCLNVAARVSHQCPVLFFSMEMSTAEIVHRLAGIVDKVPLQDLIEGKESAKAKARDGNARNLKLIIDDSAALTLSVMKSRIRNAIAKYKIGLVVIDYLQKMKSDAQKSKYEEITSIAEGIKDIAKQLAIPIITACQLNRNVEGTKDNEPTMRDLRGSGSIEENADVVMFPWRPAVYKKSLNHEDATVFVAKNRNGKIGDAHLRWQSEHCRFTEPGDE